MLFILILNKTEAEVISNLKLSLFLAHNTNVLTIRLGSKDADLYSNPVKSVSVGGGGGGGVARGGGGRREAGG